MYVIPAIDLRHGKCVRLIQGEYDRQITYKDNPIKQAEEFILAGAQWLHIIDLGGAKVGKLVNLDSIAAISDLGRLKLEVGGGIRDDSAVKQLLDLGVQRVIVGTKAIGDFDWLKEISEKFAGKIALGLDARDSKVATHGWTKESTKNVLEFAIEAAKLPLSAIIYTDIAKDGMLSGPNLERTRALVKAVQLPVIAAGGVSTVDDVKKLKDVGVEAAIIGRGLYEKTIKLADAIKAAQ